ncbi:MAG: molybdopterin-dependent oxidoreductase, partial [SAR324 cluster bacterium]|nr:molybdopterin-dependent oxidoreductase [SAR324 cluster bacterium]
VSITGDPDHPITQGFLCGKVNRYAERVYSESRVLTPLRRSGAKGEGKFVPIGWDEALDEVAERFKAIIARYGGEAILPYTYSGSVAPTTRLAGHPLFNRLGASRNVGSLCSSQAVEGQKFTTGSLLHSDVEDIAKAKLILLWGSNVVATNIHLMPFIKQARRNGARLIVIDPVRNQTAKQADWYIRIRPGTDTALALGMMRQIIAAGLHDMTFIDRYTLGYEDLQRACEAYTPQHVAEITGIAAEDVVKLAEEYGGTRSAFLRLGLGLTRRRAGGMVVRTISCLPTLTGAWEAEGGGFIRNGLANSTLNLAHLSAPRPGDPPARELPIVRLGETLLDVKDPPIMALYTYGSNPAAVVPNQARVHQGLSREDLFMVVHEQMYTDTVNFADIVLPATTFMEQDDLCSASGNRYVQVSRAAIAPVGEAKPNLEVFRMLSERMGVEDVVYSQDFDALVTELLDSPWAPEGGWDMEALRSSKAQKFQPPAHPWREGGLNTPSGKFEFYSEQMAEQGLAAVPEFSPSPEGHVDNELKRRYPLQFTCAHAHNFINGSFGEMASSRKLQNHAPSIRVSPEDAQSRGLADGGLCRVFNDRGDCFLTVQVTDSVGAGVCSADAVWWPKFHRGGKNINHLLSDDLTDVGKAPVYQEALVEIEAAG